MGKLDLNFQDEQGSNLSKFEFIKDDGSSEIGKLIRRANVTQRGTPLNAENMNKIVSAINSNYDYSHNALYKLGVYDTYVYNDDGTITITRQTGYINGKDYLSKPIYKNAANNHYVIFEDVNTNSNLENIIGNCSRVGSDSWWQSTFSQVTISYDSNSNFLVILLPSNATDTSSLSDIYVQYKLATATTEKVEANHYARYNERFILEHNKSEAEKSANVFNKDLPTLIYGTGYEAPTTANDWVKVYRVPVKGNTVYSSNKAMKVLASSDGSTYNNIGDNLTTFRTESNIKYLCLCIYVGSNASETLSRQTFSDLMLNEGFEPLPYQPYSGKPVHKKEFEDFKNSMQFIPYVSFVETTSNKDISENGTYFVIPTDPSNASLKLEVKAGASGTLQTAYFSGGIISVYRNYNSKFQICEVKIVYGAGSTAASTYISDSYSPATSANGLISRVTGKCKIYKLI